MSDPIFNVLFLCTGNTARSILAEGILRKAGAGRFSAFSAGSQPKGVVNPYALKTLAAFRSKSWEEYAEPGALGRSLSKEAPRLPAVVAKLGKGNEMRRKIKALAWWFALLLGAAANLYFIYVATTHSSDKPDDERPAFSIFSINQAIQD